jgi:hypothetical protein
MGGALALLLLVVTLGACRGVEGSGTSASDPRSVTGFDQVESHGVIELDITVGKTHSCVLSGDDNLLPLVVVEVEGDKLVLRSEKSLNPKTPLVATITMPDVLAVSLSGSSKGHVAGFDNDELELGISGSGELTASGKTKRLLIDVSGAGEADAQKVEAGHVEIEVSGAAKVDVGEPKTLDVDISGAGKVRHDGSPKIRKTISGAGLIQRR